MAFYLSNLLQKAYARLGQANYSVATGGDTATIVDSKQAGLHGDNEWALGSAIVIRDSAGASAAPENEYAYLTGYTDSTGTFTAATSAFSSSCGAGDTFMFINDFYPLYTMIELANEAVQSFGTIPLIDTSITTAAAQTEYTYPVAAKRRPPLRVEYQGKTNDANDNRWIPIDNWRYDPATAGSTGILVIPQLGTGRTVRIWYEGVHPTLKAYNSPILESLEPELVTARLVELALEWQNTRLQGGDDFLLQRGMKAQSDRMEAEAKFKSNKPRRRSKLLVVGKTETDENELDYPSTYP